MVNMRTIMPALQKAQPAPVGAEGVNWLGVELPTQRRETRVVKDLSVDEIAKEIVAWIKQ
jgi:electron transfer flavoprotein beta subunit